MFSRTTCATSFVSVLDWLVCMMSNTTNELTSTQSQRKTSVTQSGRHHQPTVTSVRYQCRIREALLMLTNPRDAFS